VVGRGKWGMSSAPACGGNSQPATPSPPLSHSLSLSQPDQVRFWLRIEARQIGPKTQTTIDLQFQTVDAHLLCILAAPDTRSKVGLEMFNWVCKMVDVSPPLFLVQAT